MTEASLSAEKITDKHEEPLNMELQNSIAAMSVA